MSRRRSPGLQIFLLACTIALPALLVSAILFREALAIPILDDYHAVLDFAVNFSQLHSVHGQLGYVVAAQHNEYKLIFEHAVMATQLILLRHISISFLVALGNLMLLPIFYVCWKNYFAEEADFITRLELFLPISWMLFQLSYAETLDWSMGSLQNMAVVAFALLSIHFLTRPGIAAFFLAWIFGALACASSANGFLLAPAGLLLLVQEQIGNQKAFAAASAERQIAKRAWVAKIAAWTLVFLLMLTAYLYRYSFPPPVRHVGLLRKALFFFSFDGGAVENMHGFPVPHLAIFVGIAIALIFAAAIRTRYRLANPFAFYASVWIFLSAMLVSSVRVAMGLQQSLSGRYKIYCDLLLIFCYAYLAQRIRASGLSRTRRQAIYFAATSCIILFSLASDAVGYKLLAKRRQRVLDGVAQYLANPAANTPMINPNEDLTPEMKRDQQDARMQLNRAIQAGVYTLPKDSTQK